MRFAGTQLSNYLDPSNFDNIAKTSMEARTTERNADMISKAHVEEAGIMGDAKVKAAKFGASATVAQGAAKGQSAMFSGLGNMASGIAGGFANRSGSDDGADKYGFDPIGSQGGGMGGRPLLNY